MKRSILVSSILLIVAAAITVSVYFSSKESNEGRKSSEVLIICDSKEITWSPNEIGGYVKAIVAKQEVQKILCEEESNSLSVELEGTGVSPKDVNTPMQILLFNHLSNRNTVLFTESFGFVPNENEVYLVSIAGYPPVEIE